MLQTNVLKLSPVSPFKNKPRKTSRKNSGFNWKTFKKLYLFDIFLGNSQPLINKVATNH